MIDIEAAFGVKVVESHVADEIDETEDSALLVARESARLVLETYDEEPEAVVETTDGFAVSGPRHAILFHPDGAKVHDPDAGSFDPDDEDDLEEAEQVAIVGLFQGRPTSVTANMSKAEAGTARSKRYKDNAKTKYVIVNAAAAKRIRNVLNKRDGKKTDIQPDDIVEAEVEPETERALDIDGIDTFLARLAVKGRLPRSEVRAYENAKLIRDEAAIIETATAVAAAMDEQNAFDDHMAKSGYKNCPMPKTPSRGKPGGKIGSAYMREDDDEDDLDEATFKKGQKITYTSKSGKKLTGKVMSDVGGKYKVKVMPDKPNMPGSGGKMSREAILVPREVITLREDEGIDERAPDIKAVHAGLLKLPDGAFAEWPVKKLVAHMKKLIADKGQGPIMKGLVNLERWNKNDNPKMSKKARAVIDAVKLKESEEPLMKPEQRDALQEALEALDDDDLDIDKVRGLIEQALDEAAPFDPVAFAQYAEGEKFLKAWVAGEGDDRKREIFQQEVAGDADAMRRYTQVYNDVKKAGKLGNNGVQEDDDEDQDDLDILETDDEIALLAMLYEAIEEGEVDLDEFDFEDEDAIADVVERRATQSEKKKRRKEDVRRSRGRFKIGKAQRLKLSRTMKKFAKSSKGKAASKKGARRRRMAASVEFPKSKMNAFLQEADKLDLGDDIPIHVDGDKVVVEVPEEHEEAVRAAVA